MSDAAVLGVYVCQLCGVGCSSEEDLLRHVELIGFHEALITMEIENQNTPEEFPASPNPGV